MFAKTTFTALIALATLGFAATSHAAPTGDGSSDPAAMSVSVSVADLNLSSPVGAKIVLRRIHNAAQTICGSEPDMRTERFAIYQACVKTTVDHTVASFDNPMVTALNNGGEPVAVAAADRR